MNTAEALEAPDLETPAPRVWSPLQEAVFGAVESSECKHLVVEALAGSGKTTTIVECLTRCYDDERILMVAFNRDIRDELKRRAPQGVDVQTLNGFGYRTVIRAHGERQVDGQLVSKRLANLMGNEWRTREARTAVARLVSIGKACLLWDADELDAAADACGLELPEDRMWPRERLTAIAARVLEMQARNTKGPIDYDDQIWLPIVQDLPIPQYDRVFVDETQDLNAAQLELVLAAAGESGRITAVGDRRQAIYGFRGADSEAIPRIIKALEARVLPLNVTYRCARAIVREAQRYVPALEAAPGAPEGSIRYDGPDTLLHAAKPGDFVISRTNAPLISLCLRWIAMGRRASIRGRDIGAGLTAWIRRAKASDVPELRTLVNEWHASECTRLIKEDRDTTNVDDKAACLLALCDGAASVTEVQARVERAFGDSGEEGILLTSTHRAKGLEADHVWLLRDTYLRRPGREEENLLYVAITRAKRVLTYVQGEVS